jgi:nucleotide-binding universal stress UspA family protein
MNAQTRRRITVVFHDKPQSQRLLELGARIASQLQAELEGVFVEDAALYRLAGLPFLRELKRDSFTEERLDAERLRKEWRAMAKLAREALERSATSAGLDWSFRIWHGEFDNDLPNLALESQMLLLGRLATLTPSRFSAMRGGAHTGPLKLGVILDSVTALEKLLEAVGELSRKPEIQLILFLMPDAQESKSGPFEQRLKENDPQHHNIRVQVPDREPATLIASLKAAACDLLMISATSGLLQGQSMKRRLSELPCPVVLVR